MTCKQSQIPGLNLSTSAGKALISITIGINFKPMKNPETVIRKQLLAILMFFTSALSISTARFEQNPQSCGMMITSIKKKKKNEQSPPLSPLL